MRHDREVMLVTRRLSDSVWSIASVTLLASGCGLIFPFDDGDDGASSAATGATSSAGGRGGEGGTGAAGAADPCAPLSGEGGCTGTASDPMNCGACGRDCLGGKCVDGVCQLAPFLRTASAPQSFTSLIIREGELYVGVSTGFLLSAQLSELGASPDENLSMLASLPLGNEAGIVTVDADTVYVAKPSAEMLDRYPFSGGSESLGALPDIVAMDASTDHLVVLGSGDIARFKKEGGVSLEPLSTSQGHSSLLVADGRIYWASIADETIYSLGLTEDPDGYSVFATNQSNARALASDENGVVFWVAKDTGFTVRRKKPGIDAIIDVSTPVSDTSASLALHCSDVYFDSGKSIRRVPRDGNAESSAVAFNVPSSDPVLQTVIDGGVIYVVTKGLVYRGRLAP